MFVSQEASVWLSMQSYIGPLRDMCALLYRHSVSRINLVAVVYTGIEYYPRIEGRQLRQNVCNIHRKVLFRKEDDSRDYYLAVSHLNHRFLIVPNPGTHQPFDSGAGVLHLTWELDLKTKISQVIKSLLSLVHTSTEFNRNKPS